MKILAFTLASLVFLLSWSNCASSSNPGGKGDFSADNMQQGRVLQPAVTPFPEDIPKSALAGNVRVDCYENNELFSTFFFQDGLYVKDIAYNTQTKRKDRETTFFYKKNRELDHAKINGAVASREDSIEIRRAFDQLNFQYALVKSKGIAFPLTVIVADEISDLSEILSIADNYSDFKIESQVQGNQKVIKFIGFNKTSRFHYSPMALLIGNGDFITIRDYVLTLENGFPLLEVYRTSVGEVTKAYSYKDGQLTDLVYKFTDLQNRSNSLEKRFEYRELNQNP